MFIFTLKSEILNFILVKLSYLDIRVVPYTDAFTFLTKSLIRSKFQYLAEQKTI